MNRLNGNVNEKLVKACHNGSLDEIKDLIKKGANPHLPVAPQTVLTNVVNKEITEHPFHAAMASNNFKVMYYFLNTIKVNPLTAVINYSIRYRVRNQIQKSISEKIDGICAAIAHSKEDLTSYLIFMDALFAKAKEKKKLVDVRVAKYIR